MITASDIDNIERAAPTGPPTLALAPGVDIEVVYDVYITDDPTGTNATAYFIKIPGDMNWEDATGTRVKRLAIVMGSWYLQNEAKATWGISTDATPDTIQEGKAYAHILTDDISLGRPHLYHPPDSGLTYPYNIGCEIEDDENENASSSRWDGIRESLRSFMRNRWVRRITLFGVLAGISAVLFVIIMDRVGPIIGACSFEILSRQVITCPDGRQGEIILYRANDCSTHTYNSCTGEDEQTTAPPLAATNILIIGGVIVLVALGVAGAYYLATRERKTTPEERRP